MLRTTAERLVARLEERFVPPEPRGIADTGLELNFLCDLLLKNLYLQVTASGGGLADELGLPFAGVVDQLVEPLRRDHLIEVRGGTGIGASSYTLAITGEGRTRARELMERNQYTGSAPVPLRAYADSVHAQTLANVIIPEDHIRHGLGSLVYNARVLSQLGPAINSGRAIFIHGHPGNGKTALAGAIASSLPGTMYIPYAIAADGGLIKFYDVHNHRPVRDESAGSDGRGGGLRAGKRFDRRWILIHRPAVTVGGELVLASLDLVFDPVAKTHEAPYQMKANGGIFLIDDFGRQQVRPRDLLNRWIMPLERRADFLTLNTGKKIEVPFEVLIVFATNLDPKELVDEAFLRRIPHKIEIGDPGVDEFREIFRRYCASFNIPYDERMLAYLLEEHYGKVHRSLRAVHPRDILQQVSDIARYRRVRPVLTKESVDEACRNYFM